MSVLNKFKLRQDLKQKLEKEEESRSGGKKKDPRILPYYDMKFGEKVKVLIVPDENGNLWHKYSSHGPNMKIRGVSAVGCRRNNDHEDCPICQRGFDLLQMSKDQNDPALKEEAKRWFPKDTTIMSVIVLESPFEVPIAEDGNEVKLMYVPYAIESLIKNALAEGQVDEDTIMTTPLWIKKSVKKGTKDTPDYTSSYFDYRSQVSDDEMAAFEDSVVEPYNYESIDLVPDSPSFEEAEEWLEETIKKDEKQKALSRGSKGGSDDGDGDGSDQPVKKLKSAAERLKEKREAQKNEPEEENNSDGGEPEEEEENSSQEETKPSNETKSRAELLRERLAKARKG